ncbi:hypothetical protein OROGR_015649 [Orobanche gracilis]
MRKKRTGKKGVVGLKLDMAKAYDRIEWSFLKTVLKAMGFPMRIISLVMSFVSTVSFSVLLNGNPGRSFQASRGLRQGDPLSPYLFILCAEVFSGLLLEGQNQGVIHGASIARAAPKISHLFFADDSIIFFRDNLEEAEVIKKILADYQQVSGQLINLDKSELSFSRNVLEDRKIALKGRLQIKAIESHSKYLGLPTFVGRSKHQVFNFVQERIWKKLKGWKEKYLSNAAREVLIKSVAQAIPTYIMGCFSLPVGLCNHIESMISRFWWGSKNGERKVHWVKWNSLCSPKSEGGMGFRSFKAFNDALLAKQGWRLSSCPDALMTKCLKAKYFPRSHFIHASVGYVPSYTWRSIQQASWVIKKGSYWRIGDGSNVRIWCDNWLPNQRGHSVWSIKPPDCELNLVSHLIDRDAEMWRLQSIHDIFLPFEADQIAQIPLMALNGEDALIWAEAGNGMFSVKTAYKAIVQWKRLEESSTSATTSNDVWKKLWKLNTLPRHKHLMWKILKNSIPSRKKLWNRGIAGPLWCHRCPNREETAEHIFRDCSWSRGVWFLSRLGYAWNSTPMESMVEWAHNMMLNTPREVAELFCAVCYNIWNARNVLCFEERVIDMKISAAKASADICEYQQHILTSSGLSASNSTEAEGRERRWKVPAQGMVKLNVDAARGAVGWGLGVVIRDHMGEVLLLASGKEGVDLGVNFAEASAIRRGLILAMEHGHTRIHVESDSLTVINGIQDTSKHNSYLSLILGEIRTLSQAFVSISFSHVFREGNVVAHNIAKYAVSNSEHIWCDDFPICFNACIHSDIISALFE